MIVTPFGDMRYGDPGALMQWQQAHSARHRAYRQALTLAGTVLQGIELDGDIDSDWFGRHQRVHNALARVLPGVNITYALEDRTWASATEFDDWHAIHTRLHAQLDRALGITG